MKKRILSFLGVLLVLIIIILTVIGLYYKPDAKPSESSEKSQKGNGIVTNIWVDEKRINNLKNYKIKYLFVDIGDTGVDGEIKTPKQEIKEFLDVIKEYERENNYDFILLPYSEINTYDYNVDSEFKENFIKDYLELIEWGFDGIYVDIEPVKIGEENDYLNFLEKLSSEIPEGKILSVYSGAVSEADERDNEWEWNLNFYKKVSDRVDLIVVPGYDFGFDNKEEYQDYMREQIRKLSSENFDSYFILGIPTHKPEPETIQNALEAYNQEASSSRFLGIGIFAEWTTDENEWKIFGSNVI